MKLLFLFEPYSRDYCLSKVIEYLYTFEPRVLVDRGLRAVLEFDKDIPLDVLRSLMDEVECISRIIILVHEDASRSIEKIFDISVNTVEKHLKDYLIRVEVRRWDKSFPIKSIDLARSIAQKLAEYGYRLNLKSNDILFVGIDSDTVYVGYSYEWMKKQRPYIPLSVVSKIVVIIDRIQTVYEAMDLIQFARAIGFEMRFYKPANDVISKALQALSIEMPSNIRVVEDLDETLKDLDEIVVLTPYGRYNERKLIEIACKGKKIGFVLGNEYEDVSQEFRARGIDIRLGPPSQMPMRTCTALSYALGLVLPALAGYIPCDEIVASEL